MFYVYGMSITLLYADSREEDWNRLEKRLDLYDMQIAYRHKFHLAVAALILLLPATRLVTG